MWSQRPVLSLSEPFHYNAEEESEVEERSQGLNKCWRLSLSTSECRMPTPCLGLTLFTELCLCPPGSQALSALTSLIPRPGFGLVRSL